VDGSSQMMTIANCRRQKDKSFWINSRSIVWRRRTFPMRHSCGVTCELNSASESSSPSPGEPHLKRFFFCEKKRVNYNNNLPLGPIREQNNGENNENVREYVWIIAFMKQSMVLRPQSEGTVSIRHRARWLHAGRERFVLYYSLLLSQTLPSTLKFIEFIVRN
jgi:hypothetical protein